MLTDDPLSAFVPCADLDRCQDLFTGVLQLPLLADLRPFASEFRCAGAMLRLTRVEELRPQPFTIAGWQVSGIEAEVDRLAGRGVWFLDPDGNNLSLSQYPPAAHPAPGGQS